MLRSVLARASARTTKGEAAAATRLAADRMGFSRRVVDELVHAARANASRDDIDAAVSLLVAAATVSRRRHTGCFTNRAIEAQLRALSARLMGWESVAETPRLPHDTRGAGGVLHVMTRAYAAGGHTRLVEGWINGDAGAPANVALTGGAGHDVPHTLRTAVEAAAGSVHILSGSHVERARQLRGLARDAIAVVVSTHENDVVPMLALAAMPQRPTVLVINHAEHVFWVGASLADMLICLRPASADLAMRRRGIPPARCIEVPIPATEPERRENRADARRALGIGTDDVALLTAGWRYKFTPFAGDDIIASLGPVLDPPDVHLVAVGPRADDELWSKARKRYGARIHAVGRQAGLQPFLDAADVFVDSYPIASLTAALEAAMFGLPVVGVSPRTSAWPPILREDDAALKDLIYDDVEAFRARLTALIRSPAQRAAEGQSARGRVSALHGPDAWAQSSHRIQEVVAGVRGRREVGLRRHRPGLGRPGVEDAILATYIAGCEDQLVRPELQLAGEAGLHAHDAPVDRVIARIDALLLQPRSPTADEYAEGVRAVGSLVPQRLSELLPTRLIQSRDGGNADDR